MKTQKGICWCTCFIGALIIDNRVHRLPSIRHTFMELHSILQYNILLSYCSEIRNTLTPLCNVLDDDTDDTQLSILLKFIRDQDTINLSDGDIEEPSRWCLRKWEVSHLYANRICGLIGALEALFHEVNRCPNFARLWCSHNRTLSMIHLCFSYNLSGYHKLWNQSWSAAKQTWRYTSTSPSRDAILASCDVTQQLLVWFFVQVGQTFISRHFYSTPELSCEFHSQALWKHITETLCHKLPHTDSNSYTTIWRDLYRYIQRHMCGCGPQLPTSKHIICHHNKVHNRLRCGWMVTLKPHHNAMITLKSTICGRMPSMWTHSTIPCGEGTCQKLFTK